MKTIKKYLVLLGCLAVIMLCNGCAGYVAFQVPANYCRYQPSEPSYTLQGFTHDGVAIMGRTTYYNHYDKYVETYVVPTSSFNVCGPTIVPVSGGPIIYSRTAVIGGWHGDQFTGGGGGGNPYRPGNATTGH